VVDRIAIDEQVGGVLTASGRVWVHAMEVDGDAILLRVDPSTDQVEAKTRIDAFPPWEVGGGAMAAGYGTLWVAGVKDLPWSEGDHSDAIVTRVDPATGEVVAAIDLGGHSAADVAVADSGAWVAVFGARQAEAVRIDPSTNRVIDTIGLAETYVRRILVFEGSVVVEERGWQGDRGPYTVLEAIDPETNQIVATTGGDSNRSLEEVTALDGRLWASTAHGFVLLDPRTLEPAAAPVPGDGPRGPLPVLTAGAGAIWFVNSEARLGRFDPETGLIDSLADMPGTPIALAVDRGTVWSLDYDGTLVRIDVSRGT
jgi:streptogramin lyase